jgi:hypothetical protein
MVALPRHKRLSWVSGVSYFPFLLEPRSHAGAQCPLFGAEIMRICPRGHPIASGLLPAEHARLRTLRGAEGVVPTRGRAHLGQASTLARKSRGLDERPRLQSDATLA